MIEEDFEDLPKSKSQIKRDLLELQALGKKLVALPEKQLRKVPLSERLRDAIVAARTFKHGAVSRQLKYIGGLMQDENEALIRVALENLEKPHKEEVNAFHKIEEWRDQLLQGNTTLLDELAGTFARFERQYVSQLIRNAKKEQTLNKPPKSARLLFKYLSEIQVD
jgi:ribosome-associated protein